MQEIANEDPESARSQYKDRTRPGPASARMMKLQPEEGFNPLSGWPADGCCRIFRSSISSVPLLRTTGPTSVGIADNARDQENKQSVFTPEPALHKPHPVYNVSDQETRPSKAPQGGSCFRRPSLAASLRDNIAQKERKKGAKCARTCFGTAT